MTDRTGRPGPATWEAGDFPRGSGDFPVGGLSWYEAAAYAEFSGEVSSDGLSTGAPPPACASSSSIVPASNFSGRAAAPVPGSTRGISAFGTSTWPATCASGVTTRAAAGGSSWAAAGTIRRTGSTIPFTQPPFDRSPTQRLSARPVLALGAEPGPRVAADDASLARSSRGTPVADAVFAGTGECTTTTGRR